MTEAATNLPVVCALDAAALEQRAEAARALFAAAEQVDELVDGYAWRFPGEGDWSASLLDFIAAERHCCAFFRIELIFAPGLGPVTLTVRGPDGAKAFIADAFLGT